MEEIEKKSAYVCGLIDGEIIHSSSVSVENVFKLDDFKEFIITQCDSNYMLVDAIYELGILVAYKSWKEIK